jgi:amidase
LAQTANGLPVGMMLSSTIGREARLLELAYELEEARPWPRIQDVAAGTRPRTRTTKGR